LVKTKNATRSGIDSSTWVRTSENANPSKLSETEIMNSLRRAYSQFELSEMFGRVMAGIIIPTMTLLLAIPPHMIFAGECCDRCGCKSNCRWVCKLVREEKKITYTCWGIAEDKFCVGSPSKVHCRERELVCEECSTTSEKEHDCKKKAPEKIDSSKSVSTGPSIWAWKTWCPGDSAQVFTKRKLMKKTETKTVPSFKWVVEDLCAECRKGSQQPSHDAQEAQ
jgi:hypothetical protein